MRNFKIGIVDDDQTKTTQIMTRLIQGFSEASPEKKSKYSDYNLEPIEIELVPELDEMIANILDAKLDCLILDYKLSSYYSIDFSGIDLAKSVQEIRFNFPIFILTSYDDDLFNNELFDAYQVFDFERYQKEPSERVELHFKIIEQILKTQKQVKNWESEMKKILPLRGQSFEIDNRILELDNLLEKSIDGRTALQPELKRNLSTEKLDVLINKIDILINEEY